jgi:uncharacterized membrane protein YfcA
VGLLVVLGAAVGVFGTLVGAGGGFILTPMPLLLYPSDSPATITAIRLGGASSSCGSATTIDRVAFA